MNVIYLHSHDAGRYVQPYGFPFENPNLMQFAKEAALFRKAFCVAPTCGPSRAALTSGQYPHQVNMYGLPGRQGWVFDDYSKHMVNQFSHWGYQTVLCGVQHEANHHDNFPQLNYEVVLEREAPPREQVGEFYEDSIDRLERFLSTRKDKRPFFLSVGIDEPHRDNTKRPAMGICGKSDRFSKTRFYDPDKLDWRYTAPPPWLPDLPEIRKDMESYREGVHLMDEYIGRVLYSLKHNDLEETTLVIITSDHGIEFPGGKKTLSDQGLQVMLMIRGPKETPFNGGKVIEPLVTHLDIFPTLCEILEKKTPHPLEGKSLVALAEGSIASLHEVIFGEQTYHGELEAIRSARTERYKYIRRKNTISPTMRHDGPSTTVMEDAGWYERNHACEAFYDLYLDPWEACNRANDPNYSDIMKKISNELDIWMTRTDDPFLTGKFPLPPND